MLEIYISPLLHLTHLLPNQIDRLRCYSERAFWQWNMLYGVANTMLMERVTVASGLPPEIMNSTLCSTSPSALVRGGHFMGGGGSVFLGGWGEVRGHICLLEHQEAIPFRASWHISFLSLDLHQLHS